MSDVSATFATHLMDLGLLVNVLSVLPLQSVTRTMRTCRGWKKLENAVFKEVALALGVDSPRSAQDICWNDAVFDAMCARQRWVCVFDSIQNSWFHWGTQTHMSDDWLRFQVDDTHTILVQGANIANIEYDDMFFIGAGLPSKAVSDETTGLQRFFASWELDTVRHNWAIDSIGVAFLDGVGVGAAVRQIFIWNSTGCRYPLNSRASALPTVLQGSGNEHWPEQGTLRIECTYTSATAIDMELLGNPGTDNLVDGWIPLGRDRATVEAGWCCAPCVRIYIGSKVRLRVSMSQACEAVA